MRIFFGLFSLILVAIVANADDSIPITQAYPGAFSPDPNILVTNVNIHGVNGYSINPFNESRRNHYDSRNGGKIKYLILHFTEETFANTVNIFTNGSSGDTNRVSAHYVITQKEKNVIGGQVLQVVPDDLRAWHAGVSSWGNDNNLNYYSIGIEHVNLGYSGNYGNNETYFPYDDDQMKASGTISQDIIKQYGILPQNVLGHEDIAPPRKPDPGPLFPWGKLYHDYGIGAWLDDDEMTKDAIILKYSPKRPYPATNDRDIFLQMIISYGFSLENSNSNKPFIISAFKKHFSANQHPELCDNVIRDSDIFWAWALEAKYVTEGAIIPTAGNECLDTSPDCAQTMSDCGNALYKPIFCRYCRKSCNLCDDSACA